MNRVAELMAAWAVELDLSEDEQNRWKVAGLAHDLLRDADPDTLRMHLPPTLVDLPDPILHGPAVAERLRLGGVEDGELLTAVAYHTIGNGLSLVGPPDAIDNHGRAVRIEARCVTELHDIEAGWTQDLHRGARHPCDAAPILDVDPDSGAIPDDVLLGIEGLRGLLLDNPHADRGQ